MKEIVITISRSGGIHFVYSDRLRGLMGQGKAQITRASYVEPTLDNKWVADLLPVCGPCLGPFDTHEEALDEEVKWLNANNLGLSAQRSLASTDK